MLRIRIHIEKGRLDPNPHGKMQIRIQIPVRFLFFIYFFPSFFIIPLKFQYAAENGDRDYSISVPHRLIYIGPRFISKKKKNDRFFLNSSAKTEGEYLPFVIRLDFQEKNPNKLLKK